MTRTSPLVEPAAEALAPEDWPKIDHLITEDDTPVDHIFCERQQRLAGIVIEEGADRFAYRQGFFVIGQTGEAVAILNDEKFQPKAW